jgi:hypothetical protein
MILTFLSLGLPFRFGLVAEILFVTIFGAKITRQKDFSFHFIICGVKSTAMDMFVAMWHDLITPDGFVAFALLHFILFLRCRPYGTLKVAGSLLIHGYAPMVKYISSLCDLYDVKFTLLEWY